MNILKTRWATYFLNYHFVWIPKYRRKVLTDKVAKTLETVIRRTAKENEIEVLALEIQPDHVHLFVSAPPRYSPAWLINTFKGVSSKRLRETFPSLHQLGDQLWTRTYYVGSAGEAGEAGEVSSETIRRYIAYIDECQL